MWDRDLRSTGTAPIRSNQKYAYCTLLCDDVMAEAAMVMVHSVKRTGTPHDMVILTLNVSNRTLDSLRSLGAKIWPITKPVPYPFAITADRMAINKPCRCVAFSHETVYSTVLYCPRAVQYSTVIQYSTVMQCRQRTGIYIACAMWRTRRTVVLSKSWSAFTC